MDRNEALKSTGCARTWDGWGCTSPFSPWARPHPPHIVVVSASTLIVAARADLCVVQPRARRMDELEPHHARRGVVFVELRHVRHCASPLEKGF